MYFFNARFRFKVPAIIPAIPGSIIAASALSPVDLQKRPFKKHSHLTNRLLDPQLYMASIDPALDAETVAKLAAYPWFHGHSVPKYDSGEYVNRTIWKDKHKQDLVSKWTRTVPTDKVSIQKAARSAVAFQLQLGCTGILLAGPLTTIEDQTLQAELSWIDAGLEACSELKVQSPIFATIAVSEPVLHISGLKNPLIHSFSSHIAARPELAGAYIVIEQADPSRYFWVAKDPLMSLLVLVDDLHRGARKRVIVNYVGTFGLVAKAVGAEIWSSGYYLAQRRFSLIGKMGRAHPRYHSLALSGDIGLSEDLGRLQKAGLAGTLMTPTSSDGILRTALAQNKTPADVPEWEYKQSNCAAAQKHYLEVCAGTGAALEKMSALQRQVWVEDWLERAVVFAGILREKGLVSGATDTDHQKVWRDVFKAWRDYAKQ